MKYSELDLEKRRSLGSGTVLRSYRGSERFTPPILAARSIIAPLLKPGGRLLMRETQPMRLFDFVFGPLVLPLQDLDAREGELFLTTNSGNNSAATPDSAKCGYRRMAARPPG